MIEKISSKLKSIMNLKGSKGYRLVIIVLLLQLIVFTVILVFIYSFPQAAGEATCLYNSTAYGAGNYGDNPCVIPEQTPTPTPSPTNTPTPTPIDTPVLTPTPSIIVTPTIIQTPTGVSPTSITPTISRKSFGDLNNDGVVNISDLSIFALYWNTTNFNADINSDGLVNLSDLSILAFNYGKNVIR